MSNKNQKYIGEIDFMKSLYFDTFLSVKMDRREGAGTIFVNYIIPIVRKDTSERLYGDLIYYFRKQKRFRFARGFLLGKTHDGKMWEAKTQYFYFDRNKAVFEEKHLTEYIYQPVNRKRP